MTDINLGDATARLAAAAEALEQTIARISAAQDSLHSKVDRIIAAIDEHALSASAEKTEELERRITALERENADLKAAAEQRPTADGAPPSSPDGAPPSRACLSRARVGIDADGTNTGAQRKTLAPFVSMLLTKSGADESSISADSAVLDKALASLSVEQRVAVKAEMARAGLIA